MLIGLFAIAAGVAVLAWSSDQFVIGAARIALLRDVPALVVGVVIIGFGTSAPEMLVSALAAVGDDVEVAIGNVVGSNLANLSLLLGIGALIVPLSVESRTVRREGVLVVAAMVAFALAVQRGGIARIEGVALLVGMAAALALVIRPDRSAVTGGATDQLRSEPTDTDEIDDTDGIDEIGRDVVELVDPPSHRLPGEIVRTAVGLAGTIGSAQLLLWGALRLADEAGLSAGFVGTTLVAVGTSLPELVTVVQSARRGETDLIVGNLLGSNLFNALAVGGLIGLIGGPPVDDRGVTLIAPVAAIVVAVIATSAMRTRHRVTRLEGVGLIVAYLAIVPLLL